MDQSGSAVRWRLACVYTNSQTHSPDRMTFCSSRDEERRGCCLLLQLQMFFSERGVDPDPTRISRGHVGNHHPRPLSRLSHDRQTGKCFKPPELFGLSTIARLFAPGTHTDTHLPVFGAFPLSADPLRTFKQLPLPHPSRRTAHWLYHAFPLTKRPFDPRAPTSIAVCRLVPTHFAPLL